LRRRVHVLSHGASGVLRPRRRGCGGDGGGVPRRAEERSQGRDAPGRRGGCGFRPGGPARGPVVGQPSPRRGEAAAHLRGRRLDHLDAGRPAEGRRVSLYLAIEGVDGAGKSTVCRALADALAAEGRVVRVVREPGGTEVGEQIRQILLHGEDMTPWSDALLFAAQRAPPAAGTRSSVPSGSAAGSCSPIVPTARRAPTSVRSEGSASKRCARSTSWQWAG